MEKKERFVVIKFHDITTTAGTHGVLDSETGTIVGRIGGYNPHKELASDFNQEGSILHGYSVWNDINSEDYEVC